MLFLTSWYMLSWQGQVHIFVTGEEEEEEESTLISLIKPLHEPCSLFMQSSVLNTISYSYKNSIYFICIWSSIFPSFLLFLYLFLCSVKG